MMRSPAEDLLVLDTPIDPQLRTRLESIGLVTVLSQATEADRERASLALADPSATESRARYLAWLRRQLRAWSTLDLPSVPVAALDWPLASVRPHCLDVVGLLLADLRELSPRTRPMVVPRQGNAAHLTAPGAVIGAAHLCVRLARPAAALLEPGRRLTAALTAIGSADRYLSRCAELAERGAGLDREIDQWGAAASPAQAQLAVVTAQRLAGQLATVLDAATRAGW